MTPNQFDNYIKREDKIKETQKKINELSTIANDGNQDAESVAKAQAQIEQLNGELENLLETNASIFNPFFTFGGFNCKGLLGFTVIHFLLT